VTRFEILRLQILQDPLLYDYVYLGEFINPSIIKFHDRMLLATGMAWVNAWNPGGSFQEDDEIKFRWLNNTGLVPPYYDDQPFLGVWSNLTLGPLSYSLPLYGQDVRFLYLPYADKVLIVYTSRMQSLVRMNALRMGCAFLSVSNNSNTLQVDRIYHMIHPDIGHHLPHKNWSPFIYNRTEIFFIQKINPLHVLRFEADLNNQSLGINVDQAPASTVSTADHVETLWQYGEIRGGTNAVYLTEHDVYLAFFHSSMMLQHGKKTYFFGAYTFSAHPPFHLVAMSPFPIVDYDKLYSGHWDPIKPRNIDYVVFPTCFYLDEGENVIHLSFGRQDHEGWLVKLNVSSLMESLYPLNYPVSPTTTTSDGRVLMTAKRQRRKKA
jgi:hypothetical protein